MLSFVLSKAKREDKHCNLNPRLCLGFQIHHPKMKEMMFLRSIIQLHG